MIRNLKILTAAAMALAAFGALSATAHAADEFHCSVAPCTLTLAPDGTPPTETAHQVLVVKGTTPIGAIASVSFTCDKLSGKATVNTQTATDVTFKNLKYTNAAGVDTCKIGASATLTVDFTSCTYTFQAAGGTMDAAQIHLLCSTPGDGIDINVKGTTCIKVTPFTATGVGYHDVDPENKKHEVLTVTTPNIELPPASVDLVNVGNASCAALGLSSVTTATYTTGNTLVTAETDEISPKQASAWYT